MAQFRNLFPNLTGDDFLAPASSIPSNIANEAKISLWAQHGDDTIIPASKLPNISIGEVHPIQLTATDAAPTATNLVAFLNAFAGTPTIIATEGDVFIVTGAGTESANVVTYLYTNATDKSFGSAVTNGTAVNGDFHQIASSAAGVSAITGGVNLTNNGGNTTGSVTLDLDATLVDITSIAPATGLDLTIGSTASDEDTVINGATLDLNSAGAVTIDATTGGVAIGADAGDIGITSSAGAVNITSSTGEIDLTGSTIDINGSTVITGAGAGEVNINNGISITTGTAGILALAASGPGTVRVSGTGITAGTDLAPNVLAVGADGDLMTTTIDSGVGAYSATSNALTDSAAQTVAVDLNSYVVIPRLSQDSTYTFTLTSPAAGNWIKILNKGNFANAQDVTDGDASAVNTTKTANLRIATINLGAGNIFAGGGTDTSIVLDDVTANFELIYDGTHWNVFTT